MKYLVGIREIHISYREVELPDGATKEDIINAAMESDDDYLEYSHTMDSSNITINLIKEST